MVPVAGKSLACVAMNDQCAKNEFDPCANTERFRLFAQQHDPPSKRADLPARLLRALGGLVVFAAVLLWVLLQA